MDSKSTIRLSQCTIILVENTELACNFFQGLFQTKFICIKQPYEYYVQVISNLATIILVNSNTCDENILTKISLISVRRIFIIVDDLKDLLLRVTECGGQVTASNISGEFGRSSCTIEGPEGVVVEAVSSVWHSEGQVTPHEWVMNALTSGVAVGEEDSDEISAQISARRMSASHARPIIHTLDVSLQSKNHPQGFVPCPPNSRRPVPFETDIFKGEALLVVRTNPLDLHYRSFFSGKRMFEVQVQGQFKVVPKGQVYVGADAENKLELGLLTRSFCRVILQFVMAMVHNLHYSFGESPDNDDHEISHIVAPLFSTMDKIVVTPAGETPPPLGVPFPEDMEFRKLRLNPSTVDRIKIDTSSIYSFSVNTSNMDLCSWTLVNIPMLKEMTLNTFCGGCPIRLVGYEVPNSNKSSDKHADKHPHKSLNYVFNLKITSVDTDKGIELNLDPSDEEVEEVDEPLEMDDDGIDEDTDIIFNEEDEDDDDMEDEGSEERSPRQWAKAPRFLRRHRNRARSLSSGDGTGLMGSGKRWRRPSVDKPDGEKTGVRGWIRKEIGELFSSDGVIGDSQESLDIEPTNDYFMEGNEGDLRYCPACIEFADHRKDGRKRFMYIFPYAVELSTTNRDTTPKLRSYQEFSKLFPICKYGKLAKNARMSQVEKLRRQLVVSYRALLSGNSTRSHMNKLEEFLGTKNDADRTFLENSSPVTVVSRGKYSQRWEGSVAMATERRHWVEKTLLVSSTEVCILRHADSRRSSGVTISLKSVLCVRPLSREEAPFPGFEYFQIETFARVFVIMVRSTQECEGWIRVFVGLLGNHISETPDLRNHPIPNLMESADIFFGRPNSFKLDRRRVFNYRRIIFHPASGLPSEILAQTPNELVEGILDKAFELVACGTSSDAALWVEFMDRISALQTLDISGINEKEKISLLLNLYHSMVLHGFLLLGPPVSQSSWASFFNSVSYLVSYDVISINELEHNGLRSSMCKPSAALLSKKIGAKASNLGSLALGQKDFRLNFCINCGSRSIPGYVPIYYPQTLDRQMDEMTALVLAETCHIDTEKKTAVLPRICSWYLKDFSKRNNGSLPIDCLRVIMPYLRELDKHALLHMLEDGISPNIRFRPFAFRCRPVAKLET